MRRNAVAGVSVYLSQQALCAARLHSWLPPQHPHCSCWDLLTVSPLQQQSWTHEGGIHGQFAKTCSISHRSVL